jgi:hypothetical protein
LSRVCLRWHGGIMCCLLKYWRIHGIVACKACIFCLVTKLHEPGTQSPIQPNTGNRIPPFYYHLTPNTPTNTGKCTPAGTAAEQEDTGTQPQPQPHTAGSSTQSGSWRSGSNRHVHTQRHNHTCRQQKYQCAPVRCQGTSDPGTDPA